MISKCDVYVCVYNENAYTITSKVTEIYNYYNFDVVVQ